MTVKRSAVLVGCNYPGTGNELRGCINDVMSMKQILIDRFQFSEENINVLTDKPDQTDQAHQPVVMPTGANIKKALSDMIEAANEGDVLYFHYSGHGTLIPSLKPNEPHRKDEAIVPCDFNLITDLDFRELVNKLPPKTTFTFLSDSCHSGGLIDQEKEQIGPSTKPGKHHRHHLIHSSRPKYIPIETILSQLKQHTHLDTPNVGTHLLEMFKEHASLTFMHQSHHGHGLGLGHGSHGLGHGHESHGQAHGSHHGQGLGSHGLGHGDESHGQAHGSHHGQGLESHGLGQGHGSHGLGQGLESHGLSQGHGSHGLGQGLESHGVGQGHGSHGLGLGQGHGSHHGHGGGSHGHNQGDEETSEPSTKSDQGILLSGCQANETSADIETKEDTEDGKKSAFGAFSDAVRQVLEKNLGPVNHKELVMMARDVLHEEGLRQHPCLYCCDDNVELPFLLQDTTTTTSSL